MKKPKIAMSDVAEIRLFDKSDGETIYEGEAKYEKHFYENDLLKGVDFYIDESIDIESL